MTQSKKQNILFVFHDSNPLSGASASMIDIIDGLKEIDDFKISVLLPGKSTRLNSLLTLKGIDVHSTNFYSCRVPVNGSIYSYFKLLAKLLLTLKSAFFFAKKDFDIVYSNTSDSYMGVFLSKFYKKKHIWHFREFGLEDQNMKHIFSDRNFYKFAFRFSNRIIVISESLKQKVNNFATGGAIELIYDDVFYQELSPLFDYTDKTLKLLMTGTLCEGKGQEFVIRALSELSYKEFPIFILHLAGDDKTEYAAHLKKIVIELDLERVVKFLGFCANMNELRQLYHVNIIASKSEAFGRVTIESMLSKSVVVATNAAANKELISKETGFLFEYNDTESFLDCLKTIYNSKNDISEVIDAAYIQGKRFTFGDGARKVNSLIKDVLSE